MKSVFLYEGSILSENIPSVSTEHSITHTNQVPSTIVTTASISSGTAKKGEEKERNAPVAMQRAIHNESRIDVIS